MSGPEASLRIPGQSVGLLTDLYQLTMAYGYWKTGELETESAFNLYFRSSPFGGGYTIACGLGYLVDFVQSYGFSSEDLTYLSGLTGNDGRPLFEAAFLDYLQQVELSCDIDAVPEGTVVFPNEPLVRLRGPLIQCQLLETPLVNILNFQSLIATKASRVCEAAQGDRVIEFGLRRAQGFDGALAASRAAYIGGCESTSNVLAGKLFGIPPRGTHAHSWVMIFDSEIEAFKAYAEAMPNNCILLVDTYDTLQGVRNAVEIGEWLRERGSELAGIRLDSGDLAYLSIEARKILDEAGFPDAAIVASNELDEHVITSLKDQGARINVWGVGTKLITAWDQPALGAVYKLAAVRRSGGEWEPRVKLSEHSAKVNIPGFSQVRRFLRDGEFIADMIYDELDPPAGIAEIVDPMDSTRWKKLPPNAAHEDLLQPVYRTGQLEAVVPTPQEARGRTLEQLTSFHPGIRRFLNPHQYPVGLERGLHDTRMRLILEARTEAASRNQWE